MALRNPLRSLIEQKLLYNFAGIAVQHRHYYKNHNTNRKNYDKYRKIAAALFGSVVIGSAVADKLIKPEVSSEKYEAGELRPDLPIYRAEEISKHDSTSSFWVIYKRGVYDVTSFLKSHPGGEQIMNAAGLSIEPFWNVYGMHKTADVYKLLETYRIGNLHEADVCDHTDEELWAREPHRDKRLVVKTARPFNAEIPKYYQILHIDTPSELFYVRQHMPVPELSAATHRLRVLVRPVGGLIANEVSLALDELSQMPQVTVRAALMCAGNRRSEMNKVKPVKGLSWEIGAISNAVWRGALLRDVLIQCGVDPNNTQGKHVILQGADTDATGVQFSTSIPLDMAMSADARVLLATSMNGGPLGPDHGHPLRVIVPGAPAVRSVKWLECITVSEEESPSHWHQKDYRSFNPSKSWETADFSTAPPLYSLPVTSAICEPTAGDTVRVVDGCIELRGYAYSGGGASILRVDVTGDGGKEWVEAELYAQDSAPPRQHYSWTLWKAKVPVNKGQQEMELWVKATDSNFNTQPEHFKDIWNIRGLLSNAYHRITVKLK